MVVQIKKERVAVHSKRKKNTTGKYCERRNQYGTVKGSKNSF